jgi:peptide/nickel transport system substrate-binding protein
MYYNSQFNLYVKEVYKTDDYTVVFKLKEPNSRFHDFFLDRWGACRPIPKHVWEKVEDPLKFQFNPPIGTGAYVLAEYDPAGYWFMYEKRKDWERSSVGILSGEPTPKYVKFQYFGEEINKAIAITRNEIDICDLTSESMKAVLGMSDNIRGYYGKVLWPSPEATCTTGATFNTAIFPYNIPDVRWALTLSIDIKEAAMIGFNSFLTLVPAFIVSSGPHSEWFYKDLQPWLKEFTISVEGKEFKVYDPDIPLQIAKLVKERGYKNVPEKDEEIRKLFGYGWWRYSPELAEKLLNKHGFKKDGKGNWLLPNGEPWKIQITGGTAAVSPEYKWAFVLAEQWRQFGIDANARPIEAREGMVSNGNFEIDTCWPIKEAWGSHPDLYRCFAPYYSGYVTPLGERAIGHQSRWSDKRLDGILDKFKLIAIDDPKTRELGIEAAKVVVEGMPGVSTANYQGYAGWNTYYWENYPGVENPYMYFGFTWSNFQFMLPYLKSTNR